MQIVCPQNCWKHHNQSSDSPVWIAPKMSFTNRFGTHSTIIANQNGKCDHKMTANTNKSHCFSLCFCLSLVFNSPPIQFKLLAPNYEFPVTKPKRQSYEWYHPKGILKRNWILKHLHVLPAVIVLFQDMEWNDSHWSEKQLQCASLMKTIKNATQGRNTRLAIVLLQKNATLTPGDDALSTERAANLASVCDINQKMIYILPYNDHLMGKYFRCTNRNGRRIEKKKTFHWPSHYRRLYCAFGIGIFGTGTIVLHKYVEANSNASRSIDVSASRTENTASIQIRIFRRNASRFKQCAEVFWPGVRMAGRNSYR